MGHVAHMDPCGPRDMDVCVCDSAEGVDEGGDVGRHSHSTACIYTAQSDLDICIHDTWVFQ